MKLKEKRHRIFWVLVLNLAWTLTRAHTEGNTLPFSRDGRDLDDQGEAIFFNGERNDAEVIFVQDLDVS